MKNTDTISSFSEYNLDPRCLPVLKAMKITNPSPVQAQAIPVALQGKNMVVTAQTGTGKTLAFALPGLTHLVESPPAPNRMLVLAPTRELCVQVESVIAAFCRPLHLRSVAIYGGVGIHAQTVKLKQGCDIIVATPGRLLDHLSRDTLQFNTLRFLVFDEADRMLDMGFLPDIRRILKQLPKKRQTLMFSATFAPSIERLAHDMMQHPTRIEVGITAKPVDSVQQLVVPVREDEKPRVILQILKEEAIDSALIFLRTIRRTERVGRALKGSRFKTAIIHGDLPQQRRQQALNGFRKGKFQVLVATDVAARGLDIDDISHVINYDIPENADDYIHRIGRTARAARQGTALTFVTPSDHAALGTIEAALGYNIERRLYEGAPKILTLFRPQEETQSPTVSRRRRGRSLLPRR
ncbi:MAG: DEAD/DEAH box helicase [Candidatus Hydrogenedentes bacterium]|nr:DEAD/DEAH box helicase [Candidatus Hydrogenedentota bacterium]